MVDLAVLSLLLQLFLTAFHVPGLRAAPKLSDEIPAGFTFICTGNGLRLIATGADGKPADGSQPALTLINCPVCLTLSPPAATTPDIIAIQAPMLPVVRFIDPSSSETALDHREAIRPGHSPPISL